MTTNKGQRTKDKGPKGRPWRFVLCPLSFVLWAAAGCTWDQLNPFHKDDAPPPPAIQDSVVLRPDGLSQGAANPFDNDPDLLAAREVFRQGNYAKAEPMFHKIAESAKGSTGFLEWFTGPPEDKDKDKDNVSDKEKGKGKSKSKDQSERSITVGEEARFYEGECFYMQSIYPKAEDAYIKCLNEYSSGAHREQAVQRLFDIANYWLEDTRKEMEESKEVREGKRRFTGWYFLHPTDKTKPFLDEQGRALEALEHVRFNQLNGKLAENALFMIGTVRFYNEDYREADYEFTQIVEKYPDSPLYNRAAEMAIISKNLSTGGSDYDGRKCAEARAMVPIALASYQKVEQTNPQLAKEREEFLRRQLAGITLQQAEKDFKMAQFYQHKGRPESAFFLYEIVRRRYPGTKYADMATEEMHRIRQKVAGENGPKLAVPEAAPLQPDSALFYQNVPGAPPGATQQPAQDPNAFSRPQPLPPSLQR